MHHDDEPTPRASGAADAEPGVPSSGVRTIDLAGRTVELHVAGPEDGTRLLVLHDAGGDTIDAPAWAQMADDHRVVQVVLPGYGDSTPPPPDADVAWVVDHLAAVLDHLVWSAAHVVGTSLGGWFALELGLARPDLVDHLTLCDPAGLHHPQAYLMALFADGRAAAGTEQLIGQTISSHLPPDQRDLSAMPPALAAATIAPYVSGMAAAALSSWNPWTPSPGMRRRLEGLVVPTTIVWGERDALIPLAHGRAMAAAIPDAVLHVVPDAGHLLAVSHPDEVVARIRG